MKQLNHPEHQALLSSDRLLKDVYSILDSRIQYIEYQTQCRLTSSIQPQMLQPTSHKVKSNSDSLARNYDQMLHFVDSLSIPLKLLQILKSWLREDNIPLIMTLLYNDTYLEFKEDQLESILKEEVVLPLA